MFDLKNGRPVVESRSLVISDGVLSLLDVQVEDEGFYVCAISDSVSTIYAQAQLVVNGKYSPLNSENFDFFA